MLLRLWLRKERQILPCHRTRKWWLSNSYPAAGHRIPMVCEVKKSNSRGWVLQRADAFPATGIGSHQTEIIHHDLSRESSVAFVAIRVLSNPQFAACMQLLVRTFSWRTPCKPAV